MSAVSAGPTPRLVTFAALVAGDVPEDLTGVRWPDGSVECRFNVTAADYPVRVRSSGPPPTGAAEVLVDPAVACDRCADKCG